MSELASPLRPALPWLWRLFDAIPGSPARVGFGLALALIALLVASELTLGRYPLLVAEGDPDAVEAKLRLAAVHCVLVAYLASAQVYALRSAHETFERLKPILGFGEAELARLTANAGHYDRRALRVAGALGIGLGLLAPLLGPGSDLYYVPDWTPEIVWHRVLAPVIGWLAVRLAYMVLEESGRLSRLAASIDSVDLLDPRPLAPFVTAGMRHALLVIGFVSFYGLFLSERGYLPIFVALALLSAAGAAAALLLPLRGVRRWIQKKKRGELDWCEDAIRRERALMATPAGTSGVGGRMADLVAYRGIVEGVHEWPFDSSTLARFGLYLLIPVGSWLGGALVERAIDALLG